MVKWIIYHPFGKKEVIASTDAEAIVVFDEFIKKNGGFENLDGVSIEKVEGGPLDPQLWALIQKIKTGRNLP